MRFACQMGMCDYRFHQEETGEAPPTFPLEPWRWCHPEMFGKCWENVRHWRRPLPCLSPGLCFQQNVREMFGIGRCPCPMGGSPLPPPLPANLRKCWEMFGKCSENVRNWCGRPKVGGWWSGRPNSEHFPNIFKTFPKICGSRLPPRWRGTHQLQTFSTNFRMAHSPGGRLGERPGQFQTFPNISEPFRTFSGGGEGRGGDHPKGRGTQQF